MDRPLIFVVDDESKIRRLVAVNLESSGFDVMTADDGRRALEVLQHSDHKPDLIVLDVMMPGLDGLEVLKVIRQHSPVPVIIVSAKNDVRTKMEGFRLGTDDYLTKPFSIEELIMRIKAILRRSHKVDESASVASQCEIRNGPIRLVKASRKCFIRDQEIRLNDKEWRLLEILMKDPGAVIPHEKLLGAVWGVEFSSEVQYLRVCFARIRKKFEDIGFDGSVISAYSGVGYILRDLRDEDEDSFQS